MEDFLKNFKKVVQIVLHGLAISQSDFWKAGPYQLLYNKALYYHIEPITTLIALFRLGFLQT